MKQKNRKYVQIIFFDIRGYCDITGFEYREFGCNISFTCFQDELSELDAMRSKIRETRTQRSLEKDNFSDDELE